MSHYLGTAHTIRSVSLETLVPTQNKHLMKIKIPIMELVNMKSFAADLVGAVLDNLKLICYFFAGVLIVTVVMYIIKWAIEWILVPLLT